MISNHSEDERPEIDSFEKLVGYEKRLDEIKSRIPENPFANTKSAREKAATQEPTEIGTDKIKNDSRESAFKSTQAIGRGFEIYAQVLTGALMIALPAVGGYFLDQYLHTMFFAPTGGVIGMVSGLSYLLRISKSRPRE